MGRRGPAPSSLQRLEQIGRGGVGLLWRATSVPVSQRTGTIRRDIAALATADIQRMREADSLFFDVTPNSPMKAGMSLLVQKPFIASNSCSSCFTSRTLPQLVIIFPQSASSVRPQNW